MAITLGVGPVDHLQGSSSATNAVTLNGTTIGRSLVVLVRWNNNSSVISSITCSGESDLTLQGSASYDATGLLSYQYATLATNTGGGSKTLTVTFDSGPAFSTILALELTGADPADIYNGEHVSSGSSTNPAGTITTDADNCAVFSAAAKAGGTTSAGTGYTGFALSAIQGAGEYSEYKMDVGVLGAISVPFTNSVNEAWYMKAAAFNPYVPPPTGTAAFNLPHITLSAVGNKSQAAEFNLPMLTLLAGDGGAQFTLPHLTLSTAAFMGWSGVAIFDLPVFTLDTQGYTGGAALAAFPLPTLILSAAALTGDAGTAVFNLPVLSLSAAASQRGVGSAALSLPVFDISAAGYTGGLGTGSFDLPALSLVVAAAQSSSGVAVFNPPLVYLDAQGQTTLTSAYRTWCLNVRKGALTEYDNFEFNSYANFNGQVLACGPSGVVVLGTQDDDNGTDITARFRTGKSDFNSSWHKRVPRIYMDSAQDGDLYFRSITVEGGTRTYALLSNNITGHQQRRIGVGKGPRSRFFQYEVENQNGTDFSVTSIMAYPQTLRRRIS